MTGRVRSAGRWTASALAALLFAGCVTVSGRFLAAQENWPAPEPGRGRLIMLGTDFGWYGVLAGVAWSPVITIDGRQVEHTNGGSIYFYLDLPAGPHTIDVADSDSLAVEVPAGDTAYVLMQPYTVPNTSLLTLRQFDYKLRLMRLDARNAIALLDRYREIPATLASAN